MVADAFTGDMVKERAVCVRAYQFNYSMYGGITNNQVNYVKSLTRAQLAQSLSHVQKDLSINGDIAVLSLSLCEMRLVLMTGD